MSDYDKIWIEVDVEQDRENKTKKLQEIMKALEEINCISNVTKIQYIMPHTESE